MRRKSMSEAKRLRLEVPPTLPCPASASSNFAGFFCGISIALGETHEKERRINAINLLTSGEIRPGDQSLRDQNRSVESGTLAITQPYLGKNSRKVVVGYHLSSKPSGFSGSGDFGMDAV